MLLRRYGVLALSFLLLLALSSCSDDNGTEPEHDTTPPTIVNVTPPQNDTGVATDGDIVVHFDESMDASTASGNVTVTPGTVSSMQWSDAQTLAVHGTWPQGSQITATVGTGLKDVAGNALAAAFTWSFWTFTPQVVLLTSAPADGAQDVPINSTIWLQFSQSMNGATLPGAITVASPAKADLPYTLGGNGDGNEWTLTMDEDLPSSTSITVTVTTDAQNTQGTPLAAEASFTFTTGTTADTTPPEILSVDPANGATLSTDRSHVTLTFSEPMNSDSIEATLISGQFATALVDLENPGLWSQNNTVFTLALRTPLVPGAIFRVEFSSFADAHGNVNTDGYDWQATVSGAAQYSPVTDSWLQYFTGTWEETTPAKDAGNLETLYKYEDTGNGTFKRWQVNNWTTVAKDLPPFLDYDSMKLTASALQFLGFHEDNDGDPSDVAFDPAVTWLPLPVATGTWNGTATMHLAEGDATVTYNGEVLAGTEDVEVPAGSGPPIVWLACRKVTLHYVVTAGGETQTTGDQTLWYAPGAGVVREYVHEVEPDRASTTDQTLSWAGPLANWPGD